MAYIGRINGVEIHSDKVLESITGNTVVFTDGSTCNTLSGEKRIRGGGYIDFMPLAPEAESITVGPIRVAATSVNLRGVIADVEVAVQSDSSVQQIEYTITGPVEQANAVKAQLEDSVLVVAGGSKRSSTTVASSVSTGKYNVSSSAGSISIVGDTIYFDGASEGVVVNTAGSATDKVKVSVVVPQGTPVTANRVQGKVLVGDTYGPLTAVTEGKPLHAGRVGAVQLTTNASGSIKIDGVYGDARLHTEASGSIKIDDGVIPLLDVTTDATGSIKIGATAHRATLTVRASGSIRVQRVLSEPRRYKEGSGSIKVGQVG